MPSRLFARSTASYPYTARPEAGFAAQLRLVGTYPLRSALKQLVYQALVD